MRVDVVLRYVGVVMIFIALFMLLSAGISYVSGMDSAFYPLLLSSLLTALLGAFPLIFVERTEQITNKEGFCVVVGSWLVACVVGTFPYLIWGGEFSLVNAWFESVSGFTTTGSTILNDVEALPRGLQFWRFSTTWVGGMGVVMFALLILPSLGRNKLTLSNVELSTLAKDNYRYRTQIIVQILLVVYVGLTVVSTLLLKMAGMNWFDSLCHAMSACATSGFSTKNASVAYFNSPMIDTILIFAMATAGIHFGLIYATVTGKRSNIFRSEVTRWYLGMLFAGGLLIAVSLYAADIYPAFTSAFRHGLFQFVSVDFVRGHPADFRLDRVCLRRIYGGRYQDQPAGAGHEDDAHAAAAAAASQCDHPHPPRRRYPGNGGASFGHDIHRGVPDADTRRHGFRDDIRRRPDDQFLGGRGVDRQRRPGLRRGQFFGASRGVQALQFAADAVGASGNIRIHTTLFH